MTNVRNLFGREHQTGDYARRVDSSGGPPHDGDMEARIAKLEAVVPTLATKADVEKASHDVTKWIVGTMVAGVGLFTVIMTFVLNNAVPKPASAQQQAAPIVIQLPATTTVTTPTSSAPPETPKK